MPKPKPDEIVRHEIVLGRAEKEMLDTLVMAQAIQSVGSGIGDIIRPFTQMTVSGAIVWSSFLTAATVAAKSEEVVDTVNLIVDAASGGQATPTGIMLTLQHWKNELIRGLEAAAGKETI